MKYTETEIEGVWLIEPRVFDDARGYFFEAWKQADFDAHVGGHVEFVQDNESMSARGVLRGLHYQKGEFSQAKLVRVIKGRVLDVAIVKYNAGNIYSVVNAMKRLGIEPVLTDDAEMLQKADRVLFPGQGQAREAMEYLKAHQLNQVIKDLKQPVLGICVGQQLLCRHSEEGDVDCIGIFDVDVKRFQPQKHEEKVPAMGWNEIYDLKTDLYKGFGNRIDSDSDKSTADALLHPYTYFVHSYYVPFCEETIAKAEYILPYSASLHKDNFYTCQFHPEKSGKVGELILKNFLEIK